MTCGIDPLTGKYIAVPIGDSRTVDISPYYKGTHISFPHADFDGGVICNPSETSIKDSDFIAISYKDKQFHIHKSMLTDVDDDVFIQILRSKLNIDGKESEE